VNSNLILVARAWDARPKGENEKYYDKVARIAKELGRNEKSVAADITRCRREPRILGTRDPYSRGSRGLP
jgi:hypothetical protein